MAGGTVVALKAYACAVQVEAAAHSRTAGAASVAEFIAAQRAAASDLLARGQAAARRFATPLVIGAAASAFAGAWVASIWIMPPASHATVGPAPILETQTAPETVALSAPAAAEEPRPMPSWLSLATTYVPTPAAFAPMSRSCAVVGDSIAAGAGQYMRKCKVNAKIGIPSHAVIGRVDPGADVNVVSAGSNDPDNPNLRGNLESIRSRASRVIWILPIDTRARAEVQAVAAEHGDPVVSFAPAGDHVHPRSEIGLARSIDALMGARPG
jgi:hypothetical protein